MSIIRIVENLIYKFRDLLWSYPDVIFYGESSFFMLIKKFYFKTRPFSHFLLSVIIYSIITVLLFTNTSAVLRINSNEYIEGIVVGVENETGNLKDIERINPLIPTNAQLEKDLSSLIYESLLEVGQNGEIQNVLIASYGEIKQANHYRFKLKNGVKWHDGSDLTTNDVKETFYLLRRLDKNIDTASNFSAAMAGQFDEIKIIDDLTFEFKLKSDEAVLPTFFETISFKIFPAKYISEIDDISIFSDSFYLNKYPIGTGKYKFSGENENTISLSRNDRYHGQKPSIKQIKFKLFPDEEKAFAALLSSQIHGLAGISTDIVERAEELKNYEVYESNVIYNQYWGLFFNLDQNSGNRALQDVKVRRAINHAINKKEILKSISGLGEETYGTIPRNSFAFFEENTWPEFDPRQASQILEDANWLINPKTKIREKDNIPLNFELVLVDNFDRVKVAEVIKENLADIGIEVKLVIEDIRTVVDKYIIPKHFDTLIYGQTTFIDPDRYELFHSSQIGNKPFENATTRSENTGLNITSYISIEQDSLIEEQELVKVPKVDTLLEDGREFSDKETRTKSYYEFQRILSNEVPIVFLYNPVYPYVVSQRISGLKLENMVSLEDRFNHIEYWNINI